MASATPECSALLTENGDKPITENQQTNKNNNSNTDMETVNPADSDEAMARLLQRMRTDMMYELRSIERSHRPVTGQEHRENLHQFMKKHITDPAESKGNVPSNVDDVAEHRPQSVVVEVQGIVEQRPVSSILQSAAFRHRLENIIRGSIQSTTRHSPSPRPHQSQRQQRQRTPVLSALSHTQNAAREEPTSNRPQPSDRVPRLPLQRRDSTDSISSVDSFSSALSSADQDDVDDDVADAASAPVLSPRQNTEHSPSPVPLPRRSLPPSTARSSPAPSVHVSPRQENDGPDAGISWSDISRVHRDELVQELSELLHNRLVSSTLEGEFRATLEVLIEDRVDSNGLAVQDFVQSLPGRGIPRNDFSHLGIGPVNDIDNSDNISIASISAHSVPYTQTNTYLGREIQGLKSQMKQMMNMIKMTHELQMDIQRSIRQEVSAALSQYSPGDGACAAPIPRSQPVQDTHCLICLDSYSDSVLYQCGHMCVCYLCGKNLIERKHGCPVCRAPIKDVIRAYKTNVE